MQNDITELVGDITTAADQEVLTPVDHNLWRRRMAQETKRAGRSRVGTGLEDSDEIAFFHTGKINVPPQRI
jgi:hypothetical protein